MDNRVVELYNILESIKNDSSKNGKEAILTKHKENQLLKEVLKFVFDDLIVTGISSKKMAKPMNVVGLQDTSLESMMDYFKKYNSGKDRDIATAKAYINTYIAEYGHDIGNMVERIVTKDLPIGISKVTINKAFGKNFIFKFDVRKGSKFEGELKKNTDYAVSTKLDGIRAIFMVDEDGVKVLGRSGKAIEGLTILESVVQNHYDLTKKARMYDGELLAFNPDNLPSDELFRVTSQMLRKNGTKEDIQFVMFDTMPLDEFKEGKSKQKFYERRQEVIELTEELTQIARDMTDVEDLYFDTVEILYTGRDMAEINKMQERVELLGFEGTMLDEMNGYYEAKRTKSLLKYKTFHTVDLRVLRVEEHKRGNKLGSIVVDYKGHELGVGSGFSDSQRDLYWNNQDLIVGKIVEVGYFEESENDKGGLSLRFPTFKMIRTDKDEVSYN